MGVSFFFLIHFVIGMPPQPVWDQQSRAGFFLITNVIEMNGIAGSILRVLEISLQAIGNNNVLKL